MNGKSAKQRRGATLHVSKLGDNSDGSSWAKAFATIQAALAAVPDDKGGHRIVVRPDTYTEANLFPAFKGAAGAYNELIGDVDGRCGSGATGHVVMDAGDPARGFKSYDWWSNFRAYGHGWSETHTEPTFSGKCWDRWAFRGLYATGSDAALFWDLVEDVEPFTVVVEDCVGIGRAFGGGVGNCLSRPEEPITFRRCTLWSLDWWGDAAGGYVRVENPSMPGVPGVIFEDCTLVGPQCALKGGNYGFHTYTRVKVSRCRLVALNFSQPHGTPTDGVIQSVQNGKYLHVDLEDTTVMGYKVFGVKVDKDSEKDIGYATAGTVLAYVQYQQEVPEGFHRLQQWPVAVFEAIVPPKPPARPFDLTRRELIRRQMCEFAGVVWQGRLCHMACVRPAGGTMKDLYLELTDAEAGKELARFAQGHSLASAHVWNGTFYAFASRWENDTWNDVTLFKSRDLAHWEQKTVLRQEKEHIFNTSVCEGPDGFVMAYEVDDPQTHPGFTIKFAVSNDLETWERVPGAIIGADRYAACPCIRYAGGYYYVLYLEHRTPRHYFETYIARSKDLKRWEFSGANPVLRPMEIDDGINASDPEVVEFEGKTYIYYCVGDQLTDRMNIKRAVYPGSLQNFCEQWYTQPGIERRN